MTLSPWHQHELNHIRGLGDRWEDMRFPVTTINPPGVASDPDIDPNTGLLLFDAASTELIFVVAQMSHTWDEGTGIRPHIHWFKTTSAEGDVAWRCRYRMFPIGDVGDAEWQDLGMFTTPPVSDNDTALTHALTSFGEIDMTGLTLSDMIIFEISRVGGDASDTYGADVALLEFDIHFIINSRGSRGEFIK